MNKLYDVIIRPLVSEKSSIELAKNHYTFVVANDATKVDVRKAIESIYKVKVVKVNTANYSGRKRKYGRIEGKESDWKKAVVYLAKDQKIEAFQS